MLNPNGASVFSRIVHPVSIIDARAPRHSHFDHRAERSHSSFLNNIVVTTKLLGFIVSGNRLGRSYIHFLIDMSLADNNRFRLFVFPTMASEINNEG
jgi:hypothetical protein